VTANTSAVAVSTAYETFTCYVTGTGGSAGVTCRGSL
jgi:hypothetical protein